jgi:hypothetical protein
VSPTGHCSENLIAEKKAPAPWGEDALWSTMRQAAVRDTQGAACAVARMCRA